MATQPEIPPDRYEPQTPDETPSLPNDPFEFPPEESPPLTPDTDDPGGYPLETPPPPD